MNISVLDKSNYLKGLLILAKKDNQLSDEEGKIIRDIAKKLGFSADFYEETLSNLLSNEFLSEDPVKFSDKRLSHSFIIDGLNLANSDSRVDQREINWLKDTALVNEIDPDWFEKALNQAKENAMDLSSTEFALYSHL